METIRRTVPRGTCVGVNPALPAEATLIQATRYRLHSFYLFDYAYRRMSPTEWLAQCDGPYLTYDTPNLAEIAGVRRIASDAKSGLLLVQKATGRVSHRRARAGMAAGPAPAGRAVKTLPRHPNLAPACLAGATVPPI